jgi:hypothetical protein
MLGKKRYMVVTVEKKREMNESSRKLLATIPMTRPLAMKKRMTGMRGRRRTGLAPMKNVSRAEMASIATPYGRVFPVMITQDLAGVERRTSPRRSIRSFMILIIRNWEMKYSGKMKTKMRTRESNGSGGESCEGVVYGSFPLLPAI